MNKMKYTMGNDDIPDDKINLLKEIIDPSNVGRDTPEYSSRQIPSPGEFME
jgi:hypothetical protein